MLLQDRFEQYLQDYWQDHLSNRLSTHLSAIESEGMVTRYIDTYHTALQTMLLSGGKRFRPILFLSVVDFYAGDLVESALDVALAIELLHTYSLIHDDLPCMDNAAYRRGVATLHTTYNEYTAVLVGDALNTQAFYQITQANLGSDVKVALSEVLSLCGGQGGMVWGQYIDLASEKESLSFNELQYLHLNKTAKLIAGSLKMGGIVASLQPDTLDKLFTLGIEIGILFQVQDDILDVTSTANMAGKDVHQDDDKNSFVKLLGLQSAIDDANRRLERITALLTTLPHDFAVYIKDKLEHYLYRHAM